jgi:hypothetical protein
MAKKETANTAKRLAILKLLIKSRVVEKMAQKTKIKKPMMARVVVGGTRFKKTNNRSQKTKVKIL